MVERTKLPAMALYHEQTLHVTAQDEKMKQDIKEKADEIQKQEQEEVD
jgi:hypothetical protein